ncbi:ead/Ea22-like family protein [Serratia marcescens]|nr:ead/Ea22-like family protein [Serratia marcescens]
MDKFNYLKEQLTAALATWQQTNGGKITVGWMHAANPEVIAALLAELEAKDKRIAELERANTSQDDHINQQQDRIDSLEKTNAGLGRRIGEAEKRLATPKPPEKCPCCNRRYTLESYAHGECAICGDPFDAGDALRAMGFTVEGDSE